MKLFRKIQKLVFVFVIIAVFILSNIQPVAAATRNEYFLSFLYSVDSKTFGYIVIPSAGRDSLENMYSNLDSTEYLFSISDAGNEGQWTIPGKMREGDYLNSYPYTFPEFNDTSGTQTDYAMASSVGLALTKSLNNAIAFVLKPVTASGRKEIGMDTHTGVWSLAAAISNSGYTVAFTNNQTFKEFTFNEKLKWSIRQATPDDMKTVKNVPLGATNRDYVVIKNYKGDLLTVPYAIPKGYTEGQELFGQQATAVPISSITKKLSWGHVVYLAIEQFSNGYTVQNNTEIKQQDKLSKAVAEFINNVVNGIAGAVGLYDVEELMFNAGNRGATHYFGIMPLSWLNPVNILNLIATVISMTVIGISIIRMLIKRNMAAITPSVKAEMMEGVKDLFIVMTGVILFMPALYILLNFNNVIVSAMRDMAPAGTNLGLTSGSDFVGIVAAIMSIAHIFIMIMLNITYITRAVTLALLIGFAPVFISLFAAGPASKKISVTWMKELISNIFMQSFNAAMLLVFANIGSFGGLTVIERFALLISFIPLTKFFKSSLMNLGSGSDAVADKTSSAFSNLATGVAIGSLGAVLDGKTPKGGKGHGAPSGSGVHGQDREMAQMTSGMAEFDTGKESLRGRVGSVAKDVFTQAPRETLKKTGQSLKEAGDKMKALPGMVKENAPRMIKETPKMIGKHGPGVIKEATKFTLKAAATGAAAGVSMGSAATGGSAILGNKTVFSGVQSMQNQAEGWFGGDEKVEKFVEQGSELAADGISGFSEGATMFTKDVREKINKDEGSDFKKSLDAYNQKPENINNPAEIIYNDTQSAIVGVKIPGVGGKTVTRKDPNTNKVISSESSYIGKGRLDEFKTDVLSKYTPKKEQK